MKKSFVDSNKAVSPFRSPEQDSHSRSYEFNKSRYTEVTIQTFDKDVPFIAIYKPDVSVERKRVQAATKVVASLLNLQKVRVIYAMNKLLAMGPQQKALRIKTMYLGCLFEKMMNKRKEKGLKGLVINKIKKNNGWLAAKIVFKIQNSILNRNYKVGLSELRRNRLMNMIKQLSDNNELASELKRSREQIAKKKEQSFSENFIEKCRKLQKNTGKEDFMQLLAQEKFTAETKKQIKKFEDLRYNGSPRRKDTLQNEAVALAISNIIQTYEASLKQYESYCQQLQGQLASYKDAEGLQQLRETIAQKDNIIRDFQAFINELGRMDIELKKYTVENKFMTDRLASTLITHDKKLQQKAKVLQGTNAKVLGSRTYLTGVISTLLKKYEQTQKQLKEFQQREADYQSSKNASIQNFENEISSMKSQIQQEKLRILTFFEKKENKSGLLDLKRKWKTNDELKGLLDFVFSLHEQIEKLNHQKNEGTKNIQKMKAQLAKKSEKEVTQTSKKFERQRSSKDESKFLQMSKKIQLQQSEALKMERQFQNKSRSLEKEKLDLTKKLQKQQSDISRIMKDLENKTKQLERERQENSRKEQQLHNSVAKLSQHIKKTVDNANQTGTPLQSHIGKDIADTLSPIVPPVEQLIDLVCRLKNGHQIHSAEKRSIYQQSFAQSDVKIYKPEVNIDEFQKQIAHRLFSHLQSELQARHSQISRNKKGETKNEDQTTTILVSDLKYKMQLLDKKLQAKSNTDELLSNAIAKIAELENTIKKLEKAILDLSTHNKDLSLKIEQLKTYYQEQVDVIQSQFRDTVNFISTQYSQKIGGFTSQQSTNARLISEKNEQIFSKQLQIQEEINSLRSQLMCTISENSFRINESIKPSEDTNILRLKITQFQSELSRKTHQKERAQNRLKQTEQSLDMERQKVSSLQADLLRLQQQLDRSHSQTDKLAMQTHDEVKKITMVLRALEEELDKKAKLAQNYQNKSSNQEKTIIKLQSQLYNIQQQLQESIRHCSLLEQRNMELNGQLNHLKTEFFSLQVELQSSRNNKNYTSSQLSSLQNQIRQKQGAINSILEQSRANSTSLNQQLFEAREQLVNQERKFEEQLTVKSALINRLEHQLIEYETTIRTIEQKCILMQQNNKRVQQETKHQSHDIRNREIELLKQQIATLQQFLEDMSHQYKQLQIKYHQEKLKFGGTPIEKLHNHQLEHSMEVIDKAIHQLSDNAPFSEEVRSLIYNNERLQISIEELQEQRFKLLEKAKKLPQREYVVQLVFNVLAGARGVSPQSSKGKAIWNELLKINQESGEVGQLFSQLQKFTLSQLTNKQ